MRAITPHPSQQTGHLFSLPFYKYPSETWEKQVCAVMYVFAVVVVREKFGWSSNKTLKILHPLQAITGLRPLGCAWLSRTCLNVLYSGCSCAIVRSIKTQGPEREASSEYAAQLDRNSSLLISDKWIMLTKQHRGTSCWSWTWRLPGLFIPCWLPRPCDSLFPTIYRTKSQCVQ